MADTELREFTFVDMVLHRERPQEKYRSRKEEEKISTYWGQRKLAMEEITFLTINWLNSIKNPIVVYAGAAPGEHTPFLSTLFPQATFHLYDPAKFKIRETEKIKIYQTYFTDEIAKQWSKRDDVFFISDIRTADVGKAEAKYGEEKGKLVVELDIITDQINQMRWVDIMRPVKASLKFRVPYTDRWSTCLLDKYQDLIEDYQIDCINIQNGIFRYLAGTVFIQAWAPPTSTEGRLVLEPPKKGPLPMFNWDMYEIEDMFFFHNTIEREQYRYLNPITNDATILEAGLENDYDGTYEAFVFKTYLYRFGGSSAITVENVYKLVRTLDKVIHEHHKGDVSSLEVLRQMDVKIATIAKREFVRKVRKHTEEEPEEESKEPEEEPEKPRKIIKQPKNLPQGSRRRKK